MSHNKITINLQKSNADGDIELNVSSTLTGSPSNNQTIIGNSSNEYEFGSAPSDVNPLTEYFYVCNTTIGSNTLVTANGYITQYVDNRYGTNYNIESGIISAGTGGDGVAYGGGGSRMHSQLSVDAGIYFCEYYPCPRWSSSGSSVFQFVQGSSSSADVKGNRSYSQSGAPARNFYSRVKSTGTNENVWPKIISNTNQRIGSNYTNAQSMIAYKI